MFAGSTRTPGTVGKLPRVPTVEFCRINRRTTDQSLQPRPFGADLRALAASGDTVADFRGNHFIAADLRVDPSETFMTGLLGFSEQEHLRSFEIEAFSWLKGDITQIEGATSRTVVPFAIDLRTARRWAAHVVSQRIRSGVFRNALAATLNAAVGKLHLLPSEWEVDPVTATHTVFEWIDEHPEVTKFSRRIKLTNPLVDIDEARRKMRALGAVEDEETFKAGRGDSLQVNGNPEFATMLSDMETGDVEVVLVARSGKGGHVSFYSSKHADRTSISEFGSDLERGIELVLDVLRDFSEQRGDVVHADVA